MISPLHSSDQKRHRLLNAHAEIEGNTIFRQWSHWFRCQISIMGNYQGGAELFQIMKLALIHYISQPYYWLKVRINNQQSIKLWLHRLLFRR